MRSHALFLSAATLVSALAVDDDANAWPQLKALKAPKVQTAVNFQASGAVFAEKKRPVQSLSKVFNLVVHVTDRANVFDEPIEAWELTASRDGYASAFVSIEATDEEDEQTFPSYVLGTELEYLNGTSNVGMDLSKFYAPYGLRLKDDKGNGYPKLVRQDPGKGDAGLTISPLWAPAAELIPSQFLACNESVASYSGQYLVVLRHLDPAVNSTIPDKCAPIRIFPQCQDIDKIFEKRKPNAEKAPTVRCYEKGGDWSKVPKAHW